MLVDLHVLFRGPNALMIAGVLTAIALCGKWLAAFFTQIIFKYTSTQRNVIFGLSSAHAAATIAVILIGYNMRIIDENVLNGTIILILITCMTASFVTASAGTRLAVMEADAKPALEEAEEKILLPVFPHSQVDGLLDFAVMIKESMVDNPIVSLAVVKDDDEARTQIVLSNRMLEKTIARASVTENEVQAITRIDLNVEDGIARTVKELGVTDVVLEWEEKGSTTDRLFSTLFGTTRDSMLSSVRETVFSCHFPGPINTTDQILVVTAQNAEYEIGFSHWMHKILRLAKETGARLVFCCTPRTYTACEAFIKGTQVALDYSYRLLAEPEDLIPVVTEVAGVSDLLVFISARKGTLSYQHYMDNAPGRLLKHFPANNIITIYPEQNVAEVSEPGMSTEDLMLMPIQEQINNFNRLGRVVKRFFKGKK
jgi:hypothetical protein